MHNVGACVVILRQKYADGIIEHVVMVRMCGKIRSVCNFKQYCKFNIIELGESTNCRLCEGFCAPKPVGMYRKKQ